MIRFEASKVVCIVDRRLTSAVEEELRRMGVGGYFAEHAKQDSVRMRRGLFGQRTVLSEAPSDIIRFHLPRGRETEAMAASASPRNPRVRMELRSAAVWIFEVECRVMAGTRSSFSMPHPLSETRMKETPPRWISQVI